MATEKITDDIKPDTRIVLIIGAGIHCAAKVKSPRGEKFLQNLASWSGLQNGFHNGGQLGHTLAWELNALANQATDDQAAKRLEEEQVALAQRLHRDAEGVLLFNWQPPEALHELLLSGVVTDVISLNVDLVLEQWLATKLSIELPAAHHRNAEEPAKKGNHNSDRVREFKKPGAAEGIRFWYPHGDVSKPASLQFGLSDYAKSLNWMKIAREKFKASERSEWDGQKFVTWLDPLLSKRQVLTLGASLDQAEWDLWFALLCRWRNYARFELADWYPVTKVLSCSSDTRHKHLPVGYIERILGATYEEAWQSLLVWIQAQGLRGL